MQIHDYIWAVTFKDNFGFLQIVATGDVFILVFQTKITRNIFSILKYWWQDLDNEWSYTLTKGNYMKAFK